MRHSARCVSGFRQNAFYAKWPVPLGMRTNSVDMDTVIETMILDVEEENGVEYEWVKDDEWDKWPVPLSHYKEGPSEEGP